MTDLTLTLHKWYLIGLTLTASAIIVVGYLPLRLDNKSWLTLMVFVSHVASTFVASPVGGFMGKTIDKNKKGMAGGWYQAANLGGMGLGGGAGIWISAHYNFHLASVVLGTAAALCGFALYATAKVPADKTGSFGTKMKLMTVDLKTMFTRKIGIFTTLMVIPPIGVGAAAYIWSSVGADWGVSADQAALVTGVLSAVASALGCVFGGWIADRFGRWWSFFGSGTFLGAVTIVMTLSPFTPFTYTTGILFYAFAMGVGTGAFSAIVLLAIGEKLASTKYALLSSLSNLPVAYMTALDGWMHDKYDIRGMLWGEAIISLVCVAISVFFLWKFSIYKTADAGAVQAFLAEPTNSEII